MITENLGKISITPKGQWVAGSYERLDLVTDAGSSYISLKDNNVSALNTADWMLVAGKGDPFEYADFTPEQIAELQQPAADAITSIQGVELSVEQAEALRVQAEIDRQTNTGTAIQNAQTATTNAQTATTNANNAATLANTKAGLADTAATNADNARLAIQADLSSKENTTNKQNSLAVDGMGKYFPTVDAVNGGLGGKQATLVSGTNIKTVNGQSLVGSGDLLPIGSLLANYTHTANKEVFISSYDINTDTFTSVGHGLADGDIIAPTLNSNVENVYPLVVYCGGMASNKVYYVINKTDNTFQISLTSGGSALNLTANVTAYISKWHFEMGTAIVISDIPASRSIKIVMYGKAQPIYGGMYMKPYNFENTGYDGAATAIYIPLSNSDAGLFSEIYYTSGATSFMLSRLNTITNATASTYTENYSTKYNIRKKDYGDITQITSNGIFVIYFNGFNIKIYKA